MLLLRRYTAADRTALREVFREIFDLSELPYFDTYLFNGPSVIGLDDEGTIQAFILVEKTPEGFTDLEIAYLAVGEAWRRRGYAKRMIKMVQEVTARASGVWLKVLETNTTARNLYEEAGFVIGERYTVDGDVGLTLVWGVSYLCNRCSLALTPATVLWEGHGHKTVPRCRGCSIDV